MGLLAFLNASRLKAELTRQRDEIARLHQMLDVENERKQEAEKKTAEQSRSIERLEQEGLQLKNRLKEQEGTFTRERANLEKGQAEERKKLEEEKTRQIQEMKIRLSALSRELDQKQSQRTGLTEQNTRLAERVAQLETSLGETAASLRQSEECIQRLEAEKAQLQRDLDKIMGKLTRW